MEYEREMNSQRLTLLEVILRLFDMRLDHKYRDGLMQWLVIIKIIILFYFKGEVFVACVELIGLFGWKNHLIEIIEIVQLL